MILWKNFLLMSKRRKTLLALLAVSVLTAYLLVVTRIKSNVTVVTKTTTFRPHSPGVCSAIPREEMIDFWTHRCSHYLSFTGRVSYTPDVEITRRLMSHLKDYVGL